MEGRARVVEVLHSAVTVTDSVVVYCASDLLWNDGLDILRAIQKGNYKQLCKILHKSIDFHPVAHVFGMLQFPWLELQTTR